MTQIKPSRDTVQITKPCPVSWESMPGDDRKRFCHQCHLHLYNLSALSRAEAADFVQRMEGRVCLRLFRRTDGTVMTQECPVGLRAVVKRFALLGGLLLFFFFALSTFLIYRGPNSGGRFLAGSPRQVEPLKTILEWIDPTPVECMGW